MYVALATCQYRLVMCNIQNMNIYCDINYGDMIWYNFLISG